MQQEVRGLASWRLANNVKSILLLAVLPLLLIVIVGGTAFLSFFYLKMPSGFVDPAFLNSVGVFSDQPLTPYDATLMVVEKSWVFVLAFACVWCVVGYLFNGALIRMSTGAKSISRSECPRLYNLLENLCISRGMQVPSLCVVETAGMNAFASGVDKRSYAITVTRGLLDNLNDQELEAVLAHELTHIRNNDVRLLIVTIVFAGMLSFFAHLLWRSLRFSRPSRDREDKSGKSTMVLMLIAAAMFAVGYLLAVFLRLAISRRREYLADAGAFELTKNADALVSALEKISGNAGLDHVSPEVQQLFIENPPSLFSWFDTHPSIASRVDALRAMAGLAPRGQTIIPSAG